MVSSVFLFFFRVSCIFGMFYFPVDIFVGASGWWLNFLARIWFSPFWPAFCLLSPVLWNNWLRLSRISIVVLSYLRGYGVRPWHNSLICYTSFSWWFFRNQNGLKSQMYWKKKKWNGMKCGTKCEENWPVKKPIDPGGGVDHTSSFLREGRQLRKTTSGDVKEVLNRRLPFQNCQLQKS